MPSCSFNLCKFLIDWLTLCLVSWMMRLSEKLIYRLGTLLKGDLENWFLCRTVLTIKVECCKLNIDKVKISDILTCLMELWLLFKERSHVFLSIFTQKNKIFWEYLLLCNRIWGQRYWNLNDLGRIIKNMIIKLLRIFYCSLIVWRSGQIKKEGCSLLGLDLNFVCLFGLSNLLLLS